MPLPDERPRQSVANLIGRFESQQKRVASSPTSQPISLPGRTVSGLHERKAALGPELEAKLANATAPPPYSSSELPADASSTHVPEPAQKQPVDDVLPTPPEPIPAEPEPEPVPEPIPEPELEVAAPAIEPESVPAEEPESIQAPPPVAASKPVRSATSVKSPPKTSSKLPPVSTTKSRATPPVSAPMAKTSSASKSNGSSSARPQPTASRPSNNAVRGVVSPVPNYMKPLRPQTTGSQQTEPKVRAKTPVTKPRTSAATSHSSAPSHLMAPTASSLAKMRTPVAAKANSTASAPATKKLPAMTKPDASVAAHPPSAMPVRQRTVSSTVPFPSVRKPKSSTGPGSVTTTKRTTAISTSGSRQSRMSQSSSKGPSAAALAALARVNAPPVPAMPSQDDLTVAPAAASTPSVPVDKSDAPVSFPTSVESPAAIDTPAQAKTVVEPLAGTSGDVLVSDSVDGTMIAPPAEPLTAAAVAAHDEDTTPGLGVVSGEAGGSASVVAENPDQSAPVSQSAVSFDGQSGGDVEASDAGQAHDSNPSHVSVANGVSAVATPKPPLTHLGDEPVEPILGPVPVPAAEGDELKDDAPGVIPDEDGPRPVTHGDGVFKDDLGIDE